MSRARWALGLVVVATVGMWLAIVLAPGKDESATVLYQQVLDARGRELTSAWLFVLAGAAFAVGAALILARLGSRVAQVGVLMLIAGSVWPVARGVSAALAVAAVDAHVGPGRFDSMTGSAAWAPLLVFLPVFLLAPLVLGIGLWRAGLAPPWPGLLWIVGVIGYVALESKTVPAGIGFAVAGVGLCWCVAAAVGRASTAQFQASRA